MATGWTYVLLHRKYKKMEVWPRWKILFWPKTSNHFSTLSMWALTEHISILYCLQEFTDSATAELKRQMKVTQVSKWYAPNGMLWAYPAPTQNCKAVQSSCQAITIRLVVVMSQQMNIDFKDLLAWCSLGFYCLIPSSPSFFALKQPHLFHLLLCLRKHFWILRRKDGKEFKQRFGFWEIPKRRQQAKYLLRPQIQG